MISFLYALGFIACFVLGGYVSFRFCEHFNRIIRGQRIKPQRRPEPDIFDVPGGGKAMFTPLVTERVRADSVSCPGKKNTVTFDIKEDDA